MNNNNNKQTTNSFYPVLQERKWVQPLWKSVWRIFERKILKAINLSYDPAIQLLSLCPNNWTSYPTTGHPTPLVLAQQCSWLPHPQWPGKGNNLMSFTRGMNGENMAVIHVSRGTNTCVPLSCLQSQATNPMVIFRLEVPCSSTVPS